VKGENEMGCLFGILDYLLIKSWIWLFFFFINSLKYMAMVPVAIFVGPGKTIHRLALSNTIRLVGWNDPEVYKIERIKVILWMSWASLYIVFVSVMIAYGNLSQ